VLCEDKTVLRCGDWHIKSALRGSSNQTVLLAIGFDYFSEWCSCWAPCIAV